MAYAFNDDKSKAIIKVVEFEILTSPQSTQTEVYKFKNIGLNDFNNNKYNLNQIIILSVQNNRRPSNIASIPSWETERLIYTNDGVSRAYPYVSVHQASIYDKRLSVLVYNPSTNSQKITVKVALLFLN